MDLSGGPSLAAFVLAALVTEITPGPNMAYLALVALGQGRARAYAAVAGVALGLALLGAGAALGLAALVECSPLLAQALRWGGVVYLLWLALDGWTERETAEGDAAEPASAATFFRRGVVTNLLNPKAFAFYLTMLPQFIRADAPVAPQALGLSALYVGIATAVHLAVVTAADAARAALVSPEQRRPVRRVMSLLLVGVALWLGWATAR